MGLAEHFPIQGNPKTLSAESAHAVFDLKHHVAWITKSRYKLLRGHRLSVPAT